MYNIILNEKIYAENAIDNLALGSKPSETLTRLAKYYHSEGYKKNNIECLLENFILKCDPAASIVKWQSAIKRIANAADKHELIDIDGIDITEAEVAKIQELNGRLLQRLMFAMLCIAKYGNIVNPNNNNWVNREDKEIFSLANVRITTKRQSLMINDLWTQNYIGYSRVVDNVNLNVKIINDRSSLAITIKDFRNLGNQYMRYIGEKYIECECCGLVVRPKKNVQKYCSDCAVDINRQKSLDCYYKNVKNLS